METNLLTAIKEDAVDAVIINEDAPRKTSFIEANTEEVTLEHLKKDCIIPVFSRDNEVCISHQSFIGSVHEAVRDFYKRGKDRRSHYQSFPHCEGANSFSDQQARKGFA